ncbi:MAG TPA: SAM-dependent methyltransferase [Pirellulaceae bacterium]|nr:SAM-dependent methyltransferase [Pirellulaceae bacterium]
MSVPSQFLFTVCQHGAEDVLKAEFAMTWPDWRLSYSRPGFVTWKLPENCTLAPDFDIRSVFARAHGFSLGKLSGDLANELAARVWSLVEGSPNERLAVDHIHVWQRDEEVPGVRGFEPGRTVLADEAAALIRDAQPEPTDDRRLPINRTARSGEAVLDCVLVEPNEWWVGWHRATTLPTRWPGGVPLIQTESEIISRAYLKLAEALRWSQLPMAKGDLCAEIGSAPGGASQLLLERGMYVLGVDPAEMDEQILANPAFAHLRARASEVKRSEFARVRWLLADANLAPDHTLDAVEAIVAQDDTHVRGLLLTLKLPEWELASRIPAYLDRVRSWGYKYVRARQLAFNRQEICVCALKNRGMRRFKPKGPIRRKRK